MSRIDEISCCSFCQSEDISFFIDVKKVNSASGIPDGRLRMHDVTPILVLGCNNCSATVETATSSEAARVLNDR